MRMLWSDAHVARNSPQDLLKRNFGLKYVPNVIPSSQESRNYWTQVDVLRDLRKSTAGQKKIKEPGKAHTDTDWDYPGLYFL